MQTDKGATIHFGEASRKRLEAIVRGHWLGLLKKASELDLTYGCEGAAAAVRAEAEVVSDLLCTIVGEERQTGEPVALPVNPDYDGSRCRDCTCNHGSMLKHLTETACICDAVAKHRWQRMVRGLEDCR